jgi:hypothetical protein
MSSAKIDLPFEFLGDSHLELKRRKTDTSSVVQLDEFISSKETMLDNISYHSNHRLDD